MTCTALSQVRNRRLGKDQDFKWDRIYDRASHFKLFKQVYRDLRKAHFSGAITDSTPTGTMPGNGAFLGSVLLPNGNLYLLPSDTNFTTTARIYNPFTNTLTTPSGTFPVVAKFAFYGGCLMNDGRVFIAPSQSTSARIYDYRSDTLIVPAPTFPGSGNQFIGAVTLFDGRVFISPHGSLTGRIYDPRNDTLFTTTALSATVNNFAGCCLLPDGRVFLVPYNSTVARIYNPWLDTVISVSNSTGGTEDFIGGVSQLGNDVFCVPAINAQTGFYSTLLGNMQYTGFTGGVGYEHSGGASLPDGRIVMSAFEGSNFRIYNPFLNAVSNSITNPTVLFGFSGASSLFNGSVYCVPHFATTARLFRNSAMRGVSSSNVVLSPFHNHAV